MSLVHWHPLKELENLRHQMNQIVETWMHPASELHQTSQIQNITWTPAIELKETDTDVILKAEVPGIEAKDLDVQVTENSVLIAGTHTSEERTEDQGVFRCELRYGQFQRWIPLPTTVQYEQTKADFKNGILTLTLPKVQTSRQSVVKLNLEEQLRNTATQNRHAEEQRQQSIHRRAEDALETMPASDLDQAMRETLTQERQHEEQRQEAVQMRATNLDR